MPIEAKTLAELAQALKAQGARLISDLTFIRAPYRCGKRWVCNVVRRKARKPALLQ